MGLIPDDVKAKIKDVADRIRKTVDESVAADDKLTALVDEYVSLVEPLPIVGKYATTAKAVIDGQDVSADTVKKIVDFADDEIDQL